MPGSASYRLFFTSSSVLPKQLVMPIPVTTTRLSPALISTRAAIARARGRAASRTDDEM